MGRVIPFSDFREYLRDLNFSPSEFARGCLLDTNVLISLTYEARDDFEEMAEFLDTLAEEGFQCFTTVTTRAEFLDFHRRLIMTEHLLEMIAPGSQVKLPSKVRAQIQVQQGQIRRYEQQGRDAIFFDSNIKRIKSAMIEDASGGLEAWKALCDMILSGKLLKVEDELKKLRISYVSPNEPAQKNLFLRKID
jgi:hypothetical protein